MGVMEEKKLYDVLILQDEDFAAPKVFRSLWNIWCVFDLQLTAAAHQEEQAEGMTKDKERDHI